MTLSLILSPKQGELLSKLKKLDANAGAYIIKQINSLQTNDFNMYLTMIVRRSGKAEGKKWQRAGVVKFPLYEELIKDREDSEVKMRKKERDLLKDLLEYIFPDIEDPDEYNAGSNDMNAPTLMALLKTVKKIATCINKVVKTFKSIVDIECCTIPTDWVNDVDESDKFISESRRIPMTSENKGATNKKTLEVENAAVQAAMLEKMSEPVAIPQQAAPQVQEPAPWEPQTPVVPVQSMVPQMVPQMPMQQMPMQQQMPQASTGEISVGKLLNMPPATQMPWPQQNVGYPMQQMYPVYPQQGYYYM